MPASVACYPGPAIGTRRWPRFRRMAEIREALARANPANPLFQSNWGGAVNDLGNRLFEAGRTAEVPAEYRRALEIQEPVVKSNPTILQYQDYLANHHANIGKALSRMGHQAEAISSYECATHDPGGARGSPPQ